MNDTETERAEAGYRDTIEKPEIFRLMTSTKVILGVVLMYAGFGIPFLMRTQSDFLVLLKEYGPVTLGSILALVGMSMAISEMTRLRRLRREDRFVDVDENRSNEDYKFQRKILRNL